MIFRNLTIYRLEEPRPLALRSVAALETLLSQRPLTQPAPSSPSSWGWVPASPEGQMVAYQGGAMLITLGIADRMLPSAVVNREAEKLAAAFEKERGFKPGRKLMKEIKEQAAATLLPQAFIRERHVPALITGNWIIVGATSATLADTLIEHLRDALGSLPVTPWSVDQSPAVTMTGWILGKEAPGELSIDNDLTLTGQADGASVVKYQRCEPLAPEVATQIKEGMRVTALRLTWRDCLNFTLTEGLQLKKIKPIDISSEPERGENDTEIDAFNADLALEAGWLKRLVGELDRELQK